jgi:hypothetical protein
MSALADAARELIVTAILDEKLFLPRRSGAERAFFALSALLAGIGAVFMALALDKYLEEVYSPGTAALLCGAAGLVLSLAAALLARRRAPPARAASEDDIRVLVEALASDLEQPVRENPKTAMAIAAAAGFFAATRRAA